MFRDDICTIKRPKISKVKGEVVYGTPETVYENVPCHLSIRGLSPAVQSQSTAKVLLDYILFIDSELDVTIKRNDIIEIVKNGQKIELRAGESQRYSITTQTHCEYNKVADV